MKPLPVEMGRAGRAYNAGTTFIRRYAASTAIAVAIATVGIVAICLLLPLDLACGVMGNALGSFAGPPLRVYSVALLWLLTRPGMAAERTLQHSPHFNSVARKSAIRRLDGVFAGGAAAAIVQRHSLISRPSVRSRCQNSRGSRCGRIFDVRTSRSRPCWQFR
jgi:hypothetical protein